MGAGAESRTNTKNPAHGIRFAETPSISVLSVSFAVCFRFWSSVD